MPSPRASRGRNKTIEYCHSERSEESPQLHFERTAGILRRLPLLRMTVKGVFARPVMANSSSVTLDLAAPFSSSIQTQISNGIMGGYAAFC